LGTSSRRFRTRCTMEEKPGAASKGSSKARSRQRQENGAEGGRGYTSGGRPPRSWRPTRGHRRALSLVSKATRDRQIAGVFSRNESFSVKPRHRRPKPSLYRKRRGTRRWSAGGRTPGEEDWLVQVCRAGEGLRLEPQRSRGQGFVVRRTISTR